VIAFDTNILVHAHRGESPFHTKAAAAVREAAEGSAPWAIFWPSVHEFLAIVTNARIFALPTPLAAAIDQVEAWMQSPTLVVLGEDAGYWACASEVLKASAVSGARVHDARIAALAVLHQIDALYTADRDFSRFATVRTVNPLV
jgi:uncharacterized protein